MNALLSGRTAVVTGANQGLGLAIARAFVLAGADVILCARDEPKLNAARAELTELTRDGQRVMAVRVDVSKAEEVARLAASALAAFADIHILVNNAGIYGPIGRMEAVDWDDWVRAIEINLLGSVLTARAFLPHMRSRGYGKIIQLSGGGATAPLPFLSSYAASKAGIVRFMETLSEEVKADGIDVNSIAPGALNTRLLEQVLEAGPEQVGAALYERSVKQKAEGGTPLQRGADLAVFLASAASDGLTGKLISAVWDPWEQFPEHLGELQESDVYTLRRIVAKERGLDWG